MVLSGTGRVLSLGLLTAALVALVMSAAVSAAGVSARHKKSASHCSATMTSYQSHSFLLHITCKSGSFSSFKVALNYALYGVSVVGYTHNGHKFSCKKSSTGKSFSCSGATVPAKTTINVYIDYQSGTSLCQLSPPMSAT